MRVRKNVSFHRKVRSDGATHRRPDEHHEEGRGLNSNLVCLCGVTQTNTLRMYNG